MAFKKSPELFYKKYVTREIDTSDIAQKPSVQVGSLVDSILTEGTTGPYEMKTLKREDAEAFERQKDMDPAHVLTERNWNKAIQIANHVERTDLWEAIMEYEPVFQEPLEGEISGVPVCGLPDLYYQVDASTIILYDIKTTRSSSLRSVRSWHFKCLDYGYYMQFALYRELLKQRFGKEVQVDCRHIAAAYEEEGLTTIKHYGIARMLIEEARKEIDVILKNMKTSEFNPPDVPADSFEIITPLKTAL